MLIGDIDMYRVHSAVMCTVRHIYNPNPHEFMGYIHTVPFEIHLEIGCTV